MRMILSLSLIATISGLLLQFTVFYTKPYIEANQKAYLKEAISELLPEVEQLTPLQLRGEKLQETKQKPLGFYAENQKGEALGFVFIAEGQGYQELIKLLFVYQPENQQLRGIKVIESKETPGLGDKIITDAEFLSQFKGFQLPLDEQQTSLLHPITLTKRGKAKEAWNVDGITGATISSKAVAKILTQGVAAYHSPAREYQTREAL